MNKTLYVDFGTGTAYTEGIAIPLEIEDIEEIERLDILNLVDNYLTFENDKEHILMFTYDELLESYTDDEISELFMPINGGEFYIYNIVHWEVV